MRLIDADAVGAMTATCPKEMDIDSFIEGMGVVLDRVYDAPTVDAVQVVRCKDCVHYEIYQLKKDGTDDRRYKPSYCVRLMQKHKPDWYCADGERKEDA